MGAFSDFENFSVNGLVDYDFLSLWRTFQCGIQKPIRDDILLNLQYFYEQLNEVKAQTIEITAAKTFNQSQIAVANRFRMTKTSSSPDIIWKNSIAFKKMLAESHELRLRFLADGNFSQPLAKTSFGDIDGAIVTQLSPGVKLTVTGGFNLLEGGQYDNRTDLDERMRAALKARMWGTPYLGINFHIKL